MSNLIIELVKVESSNIAAMGYDGPNKCMIVEFKHGGRYRYENVEKELYEAILNADSVGSTFSKMVKSKPQLFPFTKES